MTLMFILILLCFAFELSRIGTFRTVAVKIEFVSVPALFKFNFVNTSEFKIRGHKTNLQLFTPRGQQHSQHSGIYDLVLGVTFSTGTEIFLFFFTELKSILGHMKPSVQWVPGLPQPGCKDHLRPKP